MSSLSAVDRRNRQDHKCPDLDQEIDYCQFSSAPVCSYHVVVFVMIGMPNAPE
jgi:hypothetical protein